MPENKDYDLTLKQFDSYLSMVLKIYQELVPVLKRELAAVKEDDINTLNECLKSQQVLLLQTKNFDEKISEYQLKLGIKARRLSEMIVQLPEDNRLPFFELLSQFEQTSAEVRFYQDKCRSLLQSKLYLIDKALSKAKVQKDNITYNKDAAEVQGSLFSKSLEVKI